jgi:hypothetical protein
VADVAGLGLYSDDGGIRHFVIPHGAPRTMNAARARILPQMK